jgi:PleD family two-component response regulator
LEAEIIEPIDRPVTSSFGVAELASEENGKSLLTRVDAALFQAKDRGRNRVIAARADAASKGQAPPAVV